jgi:hypothetical protein
VLDRAEYDWMKAFGVFMPQVVVLVPDHVRHIGVDEITAPAITVWRVAHRLLTSRDNPALRKRCRCVADGLPHALGRVVVVVEKVAMILRRYPVSDEVVELLERPTKA